MGGGDRLARVNTVGGQGKSGEKPARSRHCDRVKEVAGAFGASHWGATQIPREGAADQPRKPGDLSPASHDNPRGKGGLNAKTHSIPAGRRVRAGSRPACSRPPRSRVGKGPVADLRVVGSGGKVLAEDSFGAGDDLDQDQPEGDLLRRRHRRQRQVGARSKAPTALGMLIQASKFTAGAEAAADHRQLLDFGLGLCGVGGQRDDRSSPGT